MKVKVSEATDNQLNWMVAKCEGRALREPVYATNKDVESSMTPFTLWETTGTYRDDTCIGAAVSPITVTRYGINYAVGASAPSISFTDSKGRSALGSVGMFFLTKEEAELDAQLCLFGGLDGYSPTTDWSQGGPIIERERIELCSYSNDGVETAFKSMGDERGNYSHEEEYVVSVPEVVVWTAWVKYGSYKQDGRTPLIAAMRCFVTSRLGDEVEVPEELK